MRCHLTTWSMCLIAALAATSAARGDLSTNTLTPGASLGQANSSAPTFNTMLAGGPAPSDTMLSSPSGSDGSQTLYGPGGNGEPDPPHPSNPSWQPRQLPDGGYGLSNHGQLGSGVQYYNPSDAGGGEPTNPTVPAPSAAVLALIGLGVTGWFKRRIS